MSEDRHKQHDERSLIDLWERLISGGVVVERPAASERRVVSSRREGIRATADERPPPKRPKR
jgi:hypothetical protein